MSRPLYSLVIPEEYLSWLSYLAPEIRRTVGYELKRLQFDPYRPGTRGTRASDDHRVYRAGYYLFRYQVRNNVLLIEILELRRKDDYTRKTVKGLRK